MGTLLTLVAYAVIMAALAFFVPIAFQAIIGLSIGLILVMVAFALLAPALIKYLINTPGGPDFSGIHFFTYPEEGMVKVIIRGKRVMRMIMLYGGHVFAKAGGRTTTDRAEHWQIISSNDSEDPLYLVHPIIRPWAQWVYELTGAVFTGIWPFQTVREYYLERTKIFREEKPGQKNNLVLQVDRDVSDHFRARQFLYPFRVHAADTKDRVPLNVLAVIKAHVTNPYKTAFGTDNWDQQTVNLATNAVTSFTGKKNFDEMLTAMGSNQDGELNQAIAAIQDDEEQYGIEIDGVDIVDISPDLSDADKSKLYSEVLANALAAATRIDGKARADALRELNKATDEGGDNSVEALRMEAFVRAAQAAAGGTIILGGGFSGGSETQTLAAILAELRKLNGQNQGGNP
jgi:regulator of protease activity HflC (stomatin/prohibitin superfamily)